MSLTTLSPSESAVVGDRVAVVVGIGQRPDGAVSFSPALMAEVLSRHLARAEVRPGGGLSDEGYVRTQFVGDVASAFSADSITRELKQAANGHPVGVVVGRVNPLTPFERVQQLARDLSPFAVAPRLVEGVRAVAADARDAAGKVIETVAGAASDAVGGVAGAFAFSTIVSLLVGLVALVLVIRYVLPVVLPVAAATAGGGV